MPAVIRITASREVEVPSTTGQYKVFPPPFLARLAELHMTLVVSVYGTEDEDDHGASRRTMV